METKVVKTNYGQTEIITTLSEIELGRIGSEIVLIAADEAGKALASMILKEKGNDLIAMVPLESILKLAVANVVLRIGATEKK